MKLCYLHLTLLLPIRKKQSSIQPLFYIFYCDIIIYEDNLTIANVVKPRKCVQFKFAYKISLLLHSHTKNLNLNSINLIVWTVFQCTFLYIWFSLTLQTPLCVSVYIIWKTPVKQNTSSNWNGSQKPKRHLVGFPLASILIMLPRDHLRPTRYRSYQGDLFTEFLSYQFIKG